ncbi:MULTISPECIES: VirB4-like conjugal transfer ATPase, CD1110 family [Dorea]|nr:type IV secretory system conjugative DNA transfer family protein [Dorea longicatena]
MNAINWKKLLLPNIPYLLFVYLFDKVGQAVRLAPGADLSGKVLSLGEGFSMAFSNPLPSLAPMDLLIGILGAVLIRLIVYVKGKNAKKYRKGIEYGSARWGTAEDIKPYTDPVFQNNVLLTQTERLTMNSRPKQPKYARNKNILVIGGSGSGKTRFFVKPNLMQMHSSYVVTDPKGTVLVECGKLLQRGGYRIKVLNTINFKKSMRYNPFAYIRSEKDILKLVNTLIANTKGDGEKAGEDFWVKSERLFYCALIGYIWYEAPEEEKREITNAFLITDDDIFICDPEAEYFALVKRLGGQVIRLSPTGKGMDGKPQYVNPMDMNLNYSEDDSPLALKSDFILSLCELVIGGKEGLQPVDKTVIDRAVRNVYRDYLADPDPAKMPILGDLYDELLKQPEPEAARIAAALELYVSGSLNVFNHRTNVELSNRLVCFDIKQLGKQLKKLGMLIVQDQIWNRVTINRAEKKSTRYYMDEFHLLLKEEQTAAYSVEIWKRFRKWGGIPTAITQNIKDLLASREVENIFENSDFVLMLNQAQGDRAILAKQLNISPQQMKYVTHTEAGEGLIFYGNVVLPFVDHFPKDTELYRIMTTKPEEVSSL